MEGQKKKTDGGGGEMLVSIIYPKPPTPRLFGELDQGKKTKVQNEISKYILSNVKAHAFQLCNSQMLT
jgi:hypothetical protein